MKIVCYNRYSRQFEEESVYRQGFMKFMYENRLGVDEDIKKCSRSHIETLVRMGEGIGTRINSA
jgi:hypothetical protein